MIPLSHTIRVANKEGSKATFEIEGLYPGYGITVGNSLRRVLLSSLEGAAATEVKIKGVDHEFSTLPGVQEDILSIILNLKQIRFRVFGDEPQKAMLSVKGEKEITAGDFETPSQVEIVNRDLVLAHLTDKTAELEMEITIQKGVGYVSAEAGKGKKQEIGTVALDAIYTPIQKVSYRIENMRVGDRTDFDRVTMEIETDGTMEPEETMRIAAGILSEQFQVIGEAMGNGAPVSKKAEAVAEIEEDGEEKETPAKKKRTTKKAA